MSKQKTTFYTQPPEGGIEFKTSRRIGDVRIPNYVYDMWLPIIGSDALAIYGVYCRLEMRGFVKKMTLSKIAKTCRIGTRKLSRINEMLAECGFVIITVPTGQARLNHWTTCIEVLDPPQKIPQTIIDKYCPKGYEILTPWLIDESQTTIAEKPNDISGEVKQHLDEVSDDISMIESLELEPLNVEGSDKNSPTTEKHPPTLDPLQHIFDVATQDQPVSEDSAPNPPDQWIENRNTVIKQYKAATRAKLNPAQEGALAVFSSEDNFKPDKYTPRILSFCFIFSACIAAFTLSPPIKLIT